MKSPSKTDYDQALSNYFHKTKGHITQILHIVEVESNTITEYEKNNIPLSKIEIIIKACMTLLGRFIATIVFCVLFLYVLNEVFEMTISFSPKNIMLLTLIFFAYKTKFRMVAENK
jgi:flagellar biosynthesis protein FliQ